MTLLRLKAEDLFEKVKGFTNQCISSSFDGLDDFGRIDEDQLAMMKSANELMNESQTYFIEQAKAMDDMSCMLDDLQKEMKEIIRKQNILLEMVEGKEKKES